MVARAKEQFVNAPYFDSNNAFIIGFGWCINTYNFNVKVIHLKRNILQTAKSISNRGICPGKNALSDKFMVAPWDKDSVFSISKRDFKTLSDYQKNLWFWLEIEGRYKVYAAKHPEVSFFEFDFKYINNFEKIVELFNWIGASTNMNAIMAIVKMNIVVNSNKTLTVVGTEEEGELQDLLKKDFAYEEWKELVL